MSYPCELVSHDTLNPLQVKSHRIHQEGTMILLQISAALQIFAPNQRFIATQDGTTKPPFTNNPSRFKPKEYILERSKKPGSA